MTPIQSKAIPAILEGKDVLGGAQTGTGKTAAFALPILHRLSDSDDSQKRNRTPRALVLTPTRELADQVGESFKDYGKYLKLRTINLDQIETLILDEADRMLDMGFIRDIQKILKYLPAKRQNLMFSATYDKDIRKLANGLLNNPVSVEVAGRNTAAEKVEQFVHHVDKTQKRHLLAHLIKTEGWYQVLVFVRTKHGANRLAKQLAQGKIPSAAIHGDKSQGARTRALSQFKQGDLQVLVATDVAARGIHLEELTHVVNFDLPQVPEDYVHRIGRTGRAGKSGTAISFVSSDEKKLLQRIETLLKSSIKQVRAQNFVPVQVETPQGGSHGREHFQRSGRPQRAARPQGSSYGRRKSS